MLANIVIFLLIAAYSAFVIIKIVRSSKWRRLRRLLVRFLLLLQQMLFRAFRSAESRSEEKKEQMVIQRFDVYAAGQ
jgi:hypothetical protein